MINRIIGLLFLAFFLVFASLIPWQIVSKGVPPNSPLPIYPQFFPIVLAVLGGFISLCLVMISSPKVRFSDENLQIPTKSNLLRVAGVGVIICFHILTFNLLGYLISTCLSLILLMAHLGLRDIKSYVLMATIFPFGIFYLFKKLLYVAFPVGFLGF